MKTAYQNELKENYPNLQYLIPEKEERLKFEAKIPDGEIPLWQYWQEFAYKYLRTGKSPITVRNARDVLRLVIRKGNILTLEDCNNQNKLEEVLFNIKGNKLAGSTFNTYRKNINTYFIWLEKKGFIKENNIKRVDTCKEENIEQPIVTGKQIEQLRSRIISRRQTQFERWRNLLFVDILILTGARTCELEDIQLRDIQEKANGWELVINGRKQKGKPRRYRMNSSLRDTFNMYMLKRQDLGRDETNLFCSQSKRTGWTSKGMNGLLKRVSKELGFNTTVYPIRRFVATKIYLTTDSFKATMHHMGHTRRSTTFRYIEKSCDLTALGVSVMNKFIT